MSEAENTTSTTTTKKKSSFKLILIGVAVLLIIGGAGGFFYWRSSTVAAASKTESKNGKAAASKTKKLQLDDEEEAEAKSETEAKAEKAVDKAGEKTNRAAKESLAAALPDDADVKHIIELQPFIVNLADADQARYLRLTVSLGVGEGGESEKPDQLLLTRVRNAMLAVLTTKNSADVLNVEGKTKLRKELLKAAQAASEEPKVEAIYITDFIVQL